MFSKSWMLILHFCFFVILERFFESGQWKIALEQYTQSNIFLSIFLFFLLPLLGANQSKIIFYLIKEYGFIFSFLNAAILLNNQSKIKTTILPICGIFFLEYLWKRSRYGESSSSLIWYKFFWWDIFNKSITKEEIIWYVFLAIVSHLINSFFYIETEIVLGSIDNSINEEGIPLKNNYNYRYEEIVSIDFFQHEELYNNLLDTVYEGTMDKIVNNFSLRSPHVLLNVILHIFPINKFHSLLRGAFFIKEGSNIIMYKTRAIYYMIRKALISFLKVLTIRMIMIFVVHYFGPLSFSWGRLILFYWMVEIIVKEFDLSYNGWKFKDLLNKKTIYNSIKRIFFI